MSTDPQAQHDQTVLDIIEHSPVGAVPHTPPIKTRCDVFILPSKFIPMLITRTGTSPRDPRQQNIFYAENLDALIAGQIEPSALENNAQIFDRYVRSLPDGLQVKAENLRGVVAGKPGLHRAKHGGLIAHDPLHTLFLVPGGGLIQAFQEIISSASWLKISPEKAPAILATFTSMIVLTVLQFWIRRIFPTRWENFRN